MIGVAEPRASLMSGVRRLTAARMMHHGRWKRRSFRRSPDVSALTDHQQPWIIPPFYRGFWFFHNVSLAATPISFGMFITRLYEGLRTITPEVANAHARQFTSGLAHF